MEEGPEIFTDVYPRDNHSGRIRRLRRYVEKLYDIDLQCTDLDDGFIENLMEEVKKPDDDSDAGPGSNHIG